MLEGSGRGGWGLNVATPPEKGSRTPSGKPTIQCPECGKWVLLESGVGTPPYRQYTCPHGHRFGLAQAGNGHGKDEALEPATKPDAPAKQPRKKAQTRNGDR